MKYVKTYKNIYLDPGVRVDMNSGEAVPKDILAKYKNKLLAIGAIVEATPEAPTPKKKREK